MYIQYLEAGLLLLCLSLVDLHVRIILLLSVSDEVLTPKFHRQMWYLLITLSEGMDCS